MGSRQSPSGRGYPKKTPSTVSSPLRSEIGSGSSTEGTIPGDGAEASPRGCAKLKLFTCSQGSSGSSTTATSSPTAKQRLPETVSLHAGWPVICTSSCDNPAERAGTGRQRSSVPRLCPKKTAHSYFYNFFFIDSSRENSSFLLLHILLCRFFGAFCPNPKETGVGPGHAQAGEGLEVLLIFRDNTGLLPFENLVGESARQSDCTSEAPREDCI